MSQPLGDAADNLDAGPGNGECRRWRVKIDNIQAARPGNRTADVVYVAKKL